MLNSIENLCKCNYCDEIFIDINPQINAKKYSVDLSKVNSLVYMNDKDDEVFVGCPNCNTDAYLSDDIDENKARDLKIIIK